MSNANLALLSVQLRLLGMRKQNSFSKGTSKSNEVSFSKLHYFEMPSSVENPYYSELLLVMEGVPHLDVLIYYKFNLPYNTMELLRKSILWDADIIVKKIYSEIKTQNK